MKKLLKVASYIGTFLVSGGLSFTALYFITPQFASVTDYRSSTDKFFDELKTLDNYEINNGQIVVDTSSTDDKNVYRILLDGKLKSDDNNLGADFDIDVLRNEINYVNCNFKYYYDNAYVSLVSDYGEDINLQFNAPTFKTALNNILSNFNVSFDMSTLTSLISDIQEDTIDTNKNQKTFISTIADYDSKIIFKTDKDYHLTSITTPKDEPINFDGVKVTLGLNSIVKGSEINLATPDVTKYYSINNAFTSFSNELSKALQNNEYSFDFKDLTLNKGSDTMIKTSGNLTFYDDGDINFNTTNDDGYLDVYLAIPSLKPFITKFNIHYAKETGEIYLYLYEDETTQYYEVISKDCVDYIVNKFKSSMSNADKIDSTKIISMINGFVDYLDSSFKINNNYKLVDKFYANENLLDIGASYYQNDKLNYSTIQYRFNETKALSFKMIDIAYDDYLFSGSLNFLNYDKLTNDFDSTLYENAENIDILIKFIFNKYVF